MRVCGPSAFQKRCNSVQIRRGLQRLHSKTPEAIERRRWAPVIAARKHAGSRPVPVPTRDEWLPEPALPCSFLQLLPVTLPKLSASFETIKLRSVAKRRRNPFEHEPKKHRLTSRARVSKV